MRDILKHSRRDSCIELDESKLPSLEVLLRAKDSVTRDLKHQGYSTVARVQWMEGYSRVSE